MARPTRPKKPKQVENFAYDERRTNIPSAEDRSLMEEDDLTPIQVAYKRRNRDLDPQLVWRGKDEQDLSDLVVQAPPLYIQERVHPKALIADLMRRSERRVAEASSKTSSPTSTACPRAPTGPTSTSTTPTGRTA